MKPTILSALLTCTLLFSASCTTGGHAQKQRELTQEELALEEGRLGVEKANRLLKESKQLYREEGNARLLEQNVLEAIDLLTPEVPANQSQFAIHLLRDLAKLANRMPRRNQTVVMTEWKRADRRQEALDRPAEDGFRIAPRVYEPSDSPSGDFTLTEAPDVVDLKLLNLEPEAIATSSPGPREIDPDEVVQSTPVVEQEATPPADDTPAKPEPTLPERLEQVLKNLADGITDSEIAELEGIIEQMTNEFAPEDPRLVDAQVNLAKIRLARGKIAEARKLLEEVLASLDGQSPEADALALEVREQLVDVHVAQEDFPGAKEHAETIYESDAKNGASTGRDPKVSGGKLRSLLIAMNDLAGLARLDNERPSNAGPPPESEAPRTKRDKDMSAWRLREAKDLMRRGRFGRAQLVYEQIIEDEDKKEDPNRHDISMAHLGLGDAHAGQGNHSKAREYFKRFLGGAEHNDDTETWEDREANKKYSNAVEADGDTEGAGFALRNMLSRYQRSMPATHPLVIAAQQDVAEWMQRHGDPQVALELYTASYEAMLGTMPNDHPSLVAVRAKVVALLRELGRHDEALALLERALTAEPESKAPAPTLAELRLVAAEHQRNCTLEQALEFRHRIVAELEQAQPKSDAALIEAMRDVAALHRVLLQVDEARTIEGQIQLFGERAAIEAQELTQIIEASASKGSRGLYAPKVAIDTPSMLAPGEYQVTASFEALSGLARLRVVQDGAETRTAILGEDWNMDPSGTSGQLQMVFRIPEGQTISVVSIAALDPNEISSEFETVVLQP